MNFWWCGSNGAKDSDDDQNAGKVSKKKQRAMLTRIERDHGTCKIPVAVNEVSIKLQTVRPTKHRFWHFDDKHPVPGAKSHVSCRVEDSGEAS